MLIVRKSRSIRLCPPRVSTHCDFWSGTPPVDAGFPCHRRGRYQTFNRKIGPVAANMRFEDIQDEILLLQIGAYAYVTYNFPLDLTLHMSQKNSWRTSSRNGPGFMSTGAPWRISTNSVEPFRCPRRRQSAPGLKCRSLHV